jgi:dGTPase
MEKYDGEILRATDSKHIRRPWPFEEEHETRNKFQRDRDRILYSKAFRRLKGKTQIFPTDSEDHLRTRLTHTLEVSQIATTISNMLGLNIFLTEAIALGHDIGHTPFGHAGEDILHEILTGEFKIRCEGGEEVIYNGDLGMDDIGFEHCWQSIRVLTELEKKSSGYSGLNLTNFTLWGILNHSDLDNKSNGFYLKCLNNKILESTFSEVDNFCWSIEALIVRQADEIAQRHHDLEDGIIAEIIDRRECFECFKEKFKKYLENNKNYKKLIRDIEQNIKEEQNDYFLYPFSRLIIDLLVMNLYRNTKKNLISLCKNENICSSEDFLNKKNKIFSKLGKGKLFDLIDYEDDFKKIEKQFSDYLQETILNSYQVKRIDAKARYIIVGLFKAFLDNPQQLPDQTIMNFYRNYKLDFYNAVKRESKSSASVVAKLRKELTKERKLLEVKFKNSLLRTIADYISGMTDNYAIKQYEILYYPIFLPIK